MEWYYAIGDQRTGPISQEDLAKLRVSGHINADTLVWRDGMPNWATYSVALPAAAFPSAPVPVFGLASSETARCFECGQNFSKSEMITFDQVSVCAACKPVYLQKLREGVLVGADGSMMWRRKKLLIAPLNPLLPRRCIKCNAPADGTPKVKNLYWHHPAIYLCLFLQVIVYIIVAMIVRKRSKVEFSMCASHRSARAQAIWISWLSILGSFVILIVGLSFNINWSWIPWILIFLGGIIYGIGWGRAIYPTKIDKDQTWIGGCGPDFLAEFPEWKG